MAQVAELTREREQLTAERDAFRSARDDHEQRWLTAVDRAEKAEAERDSWRRTAETLTRERDEARAELKIAWGEDPLVPELRAEVARLKEALAAAERTVSQLNEMNDRENSRTYTAAADLQYVNRRCDELLSRAEAAEARVRELEANQVKVLERADFFQGEHRKALDDTFALVHRLKEALAAAEQKATRALSCPRKGARSPERKR